MTDEQKAIVREQVQRYQQAQRIAAEEGGTLRRMLTLLEPRFADPACGLEFDIATLAFKEKASEPKS